MQQGERGLPALPPGKEDCADVGYGAKREANGGSARLTANVDEVVAVDKTASAASVLRACTS